MQNNKVFILLPDGVGLRNFANSGFYESGVSEGLDLVFWNSAPFRIAELGLPEIKIENAKNHPVTEIYKKAKVQVELNLNIKKSNDLVYNSYRFPFSYRDLKASVKSLAVKFVAATHSSENGLLKIRNRIKQEERKTLYYHQSLETLQQEKPAMVFCTNQRHIVTVAPLLAAQDLGIPTAAFIYSWDNLPKATLVVETDYYFVWSDFMKEELQFYYPYIREDQIFVTGTPQFEMHFKKESLLDRETFFAKYGLDVRKKYICFSGDDSTTSPEDPAYLEDVAKAVQKLNKNGLSLGVLFRRCPVDFSDRYDLVLKRYEDVIVAVDPLWKPLTTAWSAILPTKEDDELLSNIAEHCEMVLNLGSSTVFDFIAHDKPCGYFRYNHEMKTNPKWDVFACYRFVHFRSMPDNAVFWLDSADEIADKISTMRNATNQNVLENAKAWFKKINLDPPQRASKRIIENIQKIISTKTEVT